MTPVDWPEGAAGQPHLTQPQIHVLSCLYNTYGELWIGGRASRPVARLVALGLAERRQGRWHRCTDLGARVFLTHQGEQHTYEGAAARRALARMEATP